MALAIPASDCFHQKALSIRTLLAENDKEFYDVVDISAHPKTFTAENGKETEWVYFAQVDRSNNDADPRLTMYASNALNYPFYVRTYSPSCDKAGTILAVKKLARDLWGLVDPFVPGDQCDGALFQLLRVSSRHDGLADQLPIWFSAYSKVPLAMAVEKLTVACNGRFRFQYQEVPDKELLFYFWTEKDRDNVLKIASELKV